MARLRLERAVRATVRNSCHGATETSTALGWKTELLPRPHLKDRNALALRLLRERPSIVSQDPCNGELAGGPQTAGWSWALVLDSPHQPRHPNAADTRFRLRGPARQPGLEIAGKFPLGARKPPTSPEPLRFPRRFWPTGATSS